MSTNDDQIDMDKIRARLSAASGKEYWRSLEELAETPEFEELLHREFPRQASEWSDPVGRRKFLQLMGASLAFAGLTACTRQPPEQIAPYARQPEELVPGKPMFYATAMTMGGAAAGLLVESHEGRPTKIEGNPDHPASLGATDLFAQASILDLYDPDRSQTLTYLGEIRPYTSFLGEIRPLVTAQRGIQGEGLRILTETVNSPTLADQLRRFLADFPSAKWHQYEPANRDNARAGARLALGEAVNTLYRFDQAEVIFTIDADFLAGGSGSLRYVRDFSTKRRLAEGKSDMSRLYAIESAQSLTGAKADHRLPLRPSEIEPFARAVAEKIGVQTGTIPYAAHADWITALANDLQQHRGKSIIIPGDYQSPYAHALAHAMNAALGNVGSTVVYTDPIEADPVDQSASLRDLLQDLDEGKVDVLVIIGGNPVYAAPADLNFAERFQKARLRIHLGPYNDETSELCQWHVPETHYLEAWSDALAYDGTASIVQPLIAPLYRGKSAHELLAAFSDQPERAGYEIVRDYWKTRMGQGSEVGGQGSAVSSRQSAVGSQQSTVGPQQSAGPNQQSATASPQSAIRNPQSAIRNPQSAFEKAWRRALHDGFIAGTAMPAKQVPMRADWANQAAAANAPASDNQLEIIFRPDPTVYDGRFANNGWLQELPKPFSKLTWDNAALMSPKTAKDRGLTYDFSSRGGEHGEAFADVIELSYQGRTARAPIWVAPGHADDCITLHLGYGRTRAGRVGTGAGVNAYAIRASDAPWSGAGLDIRKTGERYALSNTQGHWNMEGRDIIRSGTLDHYKEHPSLAPEHAHKGELPTLYPEHEYPGYSWGMAIDLNACTGCSACVVACQAENNIPVVGKDQVAAGREMHWLRVDRYHTGNPDDSESIETYFQPLPCMQCENAPCELVCPVTATAHSAEGLNDMVYNRCVGTRYCSNNCPYKVRRFNFLLYQDWETPSLKLMRNPNVSVRSRGVMEKCTYCVQRINHAKIESEKENRQVRDGEIKTACEAVCPAEAIAFGNIKDPNSRVAKLKAEERNYSLLEELNTRPRTTYLGAVRNTNSGIKKSEA